MNSRSAQRLTIILAVVCGLLMLLALALRGGLGRGYALLDDLSEPLDMALLMPLKESRHDLPPDPHFAEIRQRPLFSNNRLPQAPIKPPPPPDTVPAVPLNATLTGTIVNKGKRLALVRDNNTSKVEVLEEGMSMPGEMMGWTLKTIDARSAVFDGGGAQGMIELKLDTSKATAGAPPPPPAPSPAMAAQPGTTQPGMAPMAATPPQPGMAASPTATPADQAAREEEVRRIIEERRAQMRAEAAKQGG
jgi:general secretion pathway protein N